MRTINIADLKNNLSAHLERVRRGEELLVKDRNRPVPLASGEVLDSEELEMAAGLIHLPTKSLPDSFWKMPAPRVSLVDTVSAVASERDGNWLTCSFGSSTAGVSGYTYTRMKR
ncbi:MAG: type II toxin-antitoxin system Phd/YefM family antitoxin [Pyrinomonadaceae bacterium]|nr:type II toxin-antitoxin system Phd/YefM family antitoxin [Pyrinomonadaceae bacterium]